MVDRISNTNSNTTKLFDRVFKNLDKNNDGILSKDETSKLRLSSFGDKPLNKEQFSDMFNKFCQKTGNINNMLDDFGDIFYKDAYSELIHDVVLSGKQQKELLTRMEMFDIYYDSLSEEQRQELLKIKSDMMCFNWFRKDAPIPKDYQLPDDKDKDKTKTLKDLPDYQYRQIKEFINDDYKKLKTELKEGKQGYKVSNAMLAKYLNFASIGELEPDGKIGGFRQGAVGDCWFLSSLMNYTSSPEGEKNIKDRIKKNEDGSYTVEFNNPFNQTKKESFTVSKEELNNYKRISRNTDEKAKTFSSGDIDVRVMEIATNKLLEKYISKEDWEKDCLPIEGSSYLKESLVHKALGYKDNIEYYFNINDKDSPDYGKIQKLVGDIIQGSDGKAKLSDLKYFNYNTTSLIDLANAYGFKDNELTCGSLDTKGHAATQGEINKKFMNDQHGYNILKIDQNEITISNPHYSSFPHVVKKELFNNSFFNMLTYFPQNNLLTIDKCTD